MAADKLVDSSLLDGALTATANAIRALNAEGSTTKKEWDMETGFADAVDAMTTSATATAGDILASKTAYAKGAKITGTIPTKTSDDMTVSGKTVTAPAGYYASSQSKSVAEGVCTPSVTSKGTNTAASFTPNATGTITDIITGTKPSGTDGTDYWTLTPGGTATTGKARAKATATISTPGYIDTTGGSTTAYTTWNITTNVDTVSSSYIPKAEISGSSTNATATTTVAPGNVTISKQNTPTGVTNAADGDVTTETVSSGVYVAVKASVAANSTGKTSTISGSGTASVTAAGYAPQTLTGNVTVTGTATAKTSSKESNVTYVPIKTGSYETSIKSHSITTPPKVTGALSGSISDVTTSTKPSGTDGTDYWTITPSTTLTTTGKSSAVSTASITSAGWIDVDSKDLSTADVIDITPTRVNGSARYLVKAVAAANSASASIETASTSSTSMTLPTTQPSSGDYFTLTATGSGSSKITTAGRIATGALPAASTTENYYLPFVAGGTKYATTSNQTISTANKYVTSNIVISKLTSSNYSAANIKDGVTISVNNGDSDVYSVEGSYTSDGTITSAHVLSGKIGYSKGTKYTGEIATLTASDVTVSGRTVTIPTHKYTGATTATAITKSVATGTVTSGSGTISTLTTTYNSTNTNFGVSGSLTVPKPTVNTAGYISGSEGTRNTGTVTVAATLPRIALKATSSSAFTKQPAIKRQTFTISGVTDASNGAETTTAPSSGVYVKVKSADNTATATINPGVETAGYGTATSGQYTATAYKPTVGALASEDTYIPIKTASPTFSAAPTGGSTATGSSITLDTSSSNSRGITVQSKYSINAVNILYSAAVSGWVSKSANADSGSDTTAKSSTNGTLYYVTALSVPKDKQFPVTTVADTALDTSSDLDVTNNAYRRVDVVNKPYATTLVDNGTNEVISWTTGHYIRDNYAVGTVISLTPKESAAWQCCVLDCKAGDKFSISATGASSGRLWCFIDSSNEIKDVSATNLVMDHEEIVAPAEATKLIINAKTSEGATIIHKVGTTTVTNTGQTTVNSKSLGSGDLNVGAYEGTNSSSVTTRQIVQNGLWVNTDVTSAGTFYGRVVVSAGSITNNTSGGTSAGTINRGNQIKIAKGYYASDVYYTAQSNSGTLTISANGNTSCDGYATVNVPAGSITNNTSGGSSTATINRGSQIKIGAGYYASDLYYTAQANSGTLTIDTSKSAQTNISVDGKANVNITGITVPKDKTFALVSTADSALDTTSDITITNNAYRQVEVTNKANGNTLVTNTGVAKVVSASATTGTLTVSAYNSSGAAENDKSIVTNGKWVATTVSEAGTFYGRVTVSAGTFTNNTTGGTSAGTINRGKQLKIGKGYYSADTFYTAQSNSGTLTISASGNSISCDGYAAVKVPAATPAFDGGALSGTATATASNATISDSTNSSGISITTACTATRAAVLYNGAVAGWVAVANNATALASGTGAMTGKTYYINGVTLTAGKSFTIAFPAASGVPTFKFTVDSSNNVTVTEV